MAPNPGNIRPSLDFKYPKDRDILLRSAYSWLDDKRNDDGAEGLWRIHDGLYDLADFVDQHPGGRMWLDLTKGTDITEAFECHHLSDKPQTILDAHFVRNAKTARNSPFTFEDDGFYRTLKRRVIPLLHKIPKKTKRLSDLITDSLCVGAFLFGTLAAAFWSFALGTVSGLLLGFTVIASHNYLHKKDNFRMYYFDLSMMNYKEWRITHALSHHLYPNSILDCEVSFIEPVFVYLPTKKNVMVKYGSWILVFFLWTVMFELGFIKRIAVIVSSKQTKHLQWSDLTPFTLPTIMYLISGQLFLPTIGMWLYIVACASFCFAMVGVTSAHHHPDIFHDGDIPRFKDKYDWGLYQLDAVADRTTITGSQFLVLTAFGDHALHHLFPTLDHGALQYLYGVLHKTMEEFSTNLKMKSQIEMMKGQFLQLARENPICVTTCS